MSRAGSQQRTLLEILARVRPHWRTDPGLPARIDALLGGDRRLGSRDRRLYREMIYAALRYLPWIEPLLDADPTEAVRRMAWLAADLPAVAAFRSEVTAGLPECPAGADGKGLVLGADPEILSPGWLREECPGARLPPLRDVLLTRAPLWLRLQTEEPGAVLREFESLGWKWRVSAALSGALQLAQGAEVARTDAYASGKVEIQDVGSQLILASVGVAPGERWLDACAGSGGKTLQLAHMLGASGRVTARDTRRSALDELALRAARSGLDGRITVGQGADPGGGYDGVLVDAPCSGTGTWRRAPHLRWVTSPEAIRKAAQLQLRLLRENARLVRQGGLLVYATCSLCASENQAVLKAFLESAPGFEPELAGLPLLPHEHDGDGFFVASLRRKTA